MNWGEVNLVALVDNRHGDVQFWEKLFIEKPESLHTILYDIYAVHHGTLGRGRRKKLDGSLDELWSIVFGEGK